MICRSQRPAKSAVCSNENFVAVTSRLVSPPPAPRHLPHPVPLLYSPTPPRLLAFPYDPSEPPSIECEKCVTGPDSCSRRNRSAARGFLRDSASHRLGCRFVSLHFSAPQFLLESLDFTPVA